MSSDTLIIADAPPRRCRGCEATCPDSAKFCWMCGAPQVAAAGSPTASSANTKLVHMVDEQEREDPLVLKLAPLLALPLVVIVSYGLFTYDPFYGVLISPALVIGALVAVGHQLLVGGVARPNNNLAKAGVAGSSLLVGLIAGAGTFAATIVVIVVLFVIMVISIIAAIAEFCGITAG